MKTLTDKILENSIWNVTPEQSKLLLNKSKDLGFNYWSGELEIQKESNVAFKDHLYFEYRESMPNNYTKRNFYDYFEKPLTEDELDIINYIVSNNEN